MVDRRDVERLGRTVQTVTNDTVELAWINQGNTCERAANASSMYGTEREVFKLPEAKLLRLLATTLGHRAHICAATRFRRLCKGYERYAETLAGLHVVAFACLIMRQAVAIAAGS